jgi:GT2 family glycosyltransferase
MLDYYKYIFVILVYRNYEDLDECLSSITNKVKSQKSIVVNAYYDDETKNRIERIATKYSCDFINIENKGYGYGNNIGIEHALKTYDFDYVVISNPDIIVNSFPDDFTNADIIAPKITSASGKLQNPMYRKYNRITDKLVYLGFKKEKKYILLCGLVINKIIRGISQFKMRRKKSYSIYAAHGSFLLISQKAILQLDSKPYDENMFLFAEEMVLAAKAQEKRLRTIYLESISVLHKEDGSMKLGDISVTDELAKSNIYYFEKYQKTV